MSYRKKLIEVALPLEAVNEASKHEKFIRHGHPSTLHIWWSRKPLATARAVIFASLVDDPNSPDALPAFVEACRRLPKGPNAAINDTPRMRLFDFIERLVQWESTTNEAVLNTVRELIMIATEGNPPPLLDPFAGGGSIPLEAQRLGLEAHASDLNPVAVMINKAQIEIPPRFANRPPVNPRDRERISNDEGWKGAAGLAADLSYYGEWIREKALERIGQLYPTLNGETVIAWIWARTVKSPNPAVDVQIPLVQSFELSKKKAKRVWIEPVIETHGELGLNYKVGTPTHLIKYVVHHEENGDDATNIPDGTVNRRGGRCIVTGVPVPFDHIRLEGKAGRIGTQLIAIVTEGANGRSYYSPTEQHETLAQVTVPEDLPNTELPEQALGFRVQLYGMDQHIKLFTDRQLVALSCFSDLVMEARKQIFHDAKETDISTEDVPLRENGKGASAYSEAISVYLALAIDRCTDFWSNLATWANPANMEIVRTVFSRQALAMIWGFAEANPFSDSGGNWTGNLNHVIKAVEYLQPSENDKSTAIQVNATELSSQFTGLLISTDPPYYDNIGYADLSDYYYIWLRRSLREVFPDIFGTMLVPKQPELIATPFRFGGNRDAANKHFEQGLQQVFFHLRRIAEYNYPITVYYAFKQQEQENEEVDDESTPQERSSTGWETMLSSLIDSGLAINGTWPIRTERSVRTNSIGANALASSIVLVCRPRSDEAPTISRSRFIDLLRKELPSALKEMQSGNIAPVDLAQSSIGPGMAIYSRYKAVLEPDGKPLSIRTALGLINQELDTYLSEQDGNIDGDTRFAISWFEQFGFTEGEFGLADVLARAKNTSVHGIQEAGVVKAERGKVRLVHWKVYDPGVYDPQSDKHATIWEATHHLIERLSSHGEEGAAMLMNKMNPEVTGEARNLAYRLYSICERKGWADHARDYNTLVIQWPSIAEQAAQIRRDQAANVATQQGKLFD